MCCSTGVCGPQADPVLIHSAADIKWLQDQGIEVRRFSLSQSPAAFVESEAVKAALTEKGEAALPVLLLNGQLLASGRYPGRDQLIEALGLVSYETIPAKPGEKPRYFEFKQGQFFLRRGVRLPLMPGQFRGEGGGGFVVAIHS
jgi:hypothetical protein